MPIQEEQTKRIYDGTSDWSGGQNAGVRGNLIAQNQYQEGENVQCRGGNLKTRPRFRQRTFNRLNDVYYTANGDLADPDNPEGDGTTATLALGLFQGAIYYDPPNDAASIIAMIGGRMFRIVPRRTTADLTEIELARQNRADIGIDYLCQADRYLLVQDGESSCIIYDGVTARRAGKDEMPVGTIMAYGQGRLVLIGRNKRDILFGDLYGSHEGEPGASVLKFTETTFLAEGGAASIPFTMGHIRGLYFYPQQDTAMGQGQLIVAAEKGFASFFLSLPREQWKTSEFQRMATLDIGGRAHRSFTAVNGDVWFRSNDGYRLYRQARAEVRGYAQVPLSTEVQNFVDKETEALLYLASSIRWNNRLITTSTPIPNQGKPYHNGLLSLDFDVLSGFGSAKAPSWDGHWSGIKVTQLVEGIFEGVHRAFAFGLLNGQNVLYEIVDSDSVTEDTSGPVTSYVVPRTYNFQSPFNETRSCDLDLWPEGIGRTTSLFFYLRPDRYPKWVEWNPAVNIHDLQPVTGVDSIAGIPTTGRGFKPRLGISTPLVAADTFATNRDLKRFYEVDIKLQWTGYMELKQLRLHDTSQVEKSTSNR